MYRGEPYNRVGRARRKISRTPLKVPESRFMGVSQIHFHPKEVPIQQQQITSVAQIHFSDR